MAIFTLQNRGSCQKVWKENKHKFTKNDLLPAEGFQKNKPIFRLTPNILCYYSKTLIKGMMESLDLKPVWPQLAIGQFLNFWHRFHFDHVNNKWIPPILYINSNILIIGMMNSLDLKPVWPQLAWRPMFQRLNIPCFVRAPAANEVKSHLVV